MSDKPGDGSMRGRVTGGRPLAMRAQDDRGAAYMYTAAVERSEAAFRHVHDLLRDAPKVVGTAGELAALVAALPPQTALNIDETVRGLRV